MDGTVDMGMASEELSGDLRANPVVGGRIRPMTPPLHVENLL